MYKILHISIVLFAIFYTSLTLASDDDHELLMEHIRSHESLEIKQRDMVINELFSILLHQYKDISKTELIAILRRHPDAIDRPEYVSTEGNYVFFGATTKFEFKKNKLVNVYW